MRYRILLLTALMLITEIAIDAAPPLKTGKSGRSSSGETKFMVGLKGGVTFTQPVIFERFNVMVPIGDNATESERKIYRSLVRNPGYQYAFTALYKLADLLDVRFEPTFTKYNYKYQNEYSWISTGSNDERIDYLINHRQSLNYLELPLTARLLYGSGSARPFIHGGIYYGFLLNAIKSSETIETYSSGSGNTVLNTSSVTGDASPLYVKSRYGFNAGVGLDYDLSVVHLTFDLNLNFGINKVSNESARYSMQQYTGGLYDVQDNLRLVVPSVNIGLLFPLSKPSAKSKLVCRL